MRMETETETVRELGHFIAHSDERESGVTTDMAKEYFAIMRFWAPAYMPTAGGGMQKHYNFDNMPPDFGAYLVANFKNLSRKTVFEQTGLKQRDAIKTFDLILPKFSRYANGRYHLVQYLT